MLADVVTQTIKLETTTATNDRPAEEILRGMKKRVSELVKGRYKYAINQEELPNISLLFPD